MPKLRKTSQIFTKSFLRSREMVFQASRLFSCHGSCDHFTSSKNGVLCLDERRDVSFCASNQRVDLVNFVERDYTWIMAYVLLTIQEKHLANRNSTLSLTLCFSKCMNLFDFYPVYLLCNTFGKRFCLLHQCTWCVTHTRLQSITCLCVQPKWATCPSWGRMGLTIPPLLLHSSKGCCLPSDRAYCTVCDASQSTLPVNYTISQSQPPRARQALRPSNPHHPRITEGICWLIASARRACCSRRGADLLLEWMNL